MRVYYMRDNHTFLPLPLIYDEAIQLVLREAKEGFSHGMLCAGDGCDYGHVHMRGMADWPRFEKEARKWFQQFTTPPQENDR